MSSTRQYSPFSAFSLASSSASTSSAVPRMVFSCSLVRSQLAEIRQPGSVSPIVRTSSMTRCGLSCTTPMGVPLRFMDSSFSRSSFFCRGRKP